MSLSILENGSSDRRSAVEVHGFALLTLSFQTLGVSWVDTVNLIYSYQTQESFTQALVLHRCMCSTEFGMQTIQPLQKKTSAAALALSYGL